MNYEQLCTKYGTETIDKLDSYEFWQLETKGVILINNQFYPLEEYLQIKNKIAAPFAGYDYEDDSYTFTQWVNAQAELELHQILEIQ